MSSSNAPALRTAVSAQLRRYRNAVLPYFEK
jgi:hypothetical protein